MFCEIVVQFAATFGVARSTLQTRKLWWMTRPTVTRVTFDLPECEELKKENEKKHKQTQKQEKRKWKDTQVRKKRGGEQYMEKKMKNNKKVQQKHY